jgi:hypothetical protein
MENATVLPTAARIVSTSARTRFPWHGWIAVCAVACLPIGLLWDISWHSTIGRDTFWTPAHIVIQLGGMVPAMLFAWLAFKTTVRGTHDERAATVDFFGARAPLGAWVTMWGAAAMLTSAPFDDWWHNTYGLDVQIVSPPHSIIGLGMLAVTVGVLLFVFSWQNRTADGRGHAPLLCALAAGVMLTLFSDFLTEFTFPNQQHAPTFYKITAAVYPLALVLTARASQLPAAATLAAGTYLVVLVSMISILPLFPAQPKLAPIYNPVTHMVPPAFPLLVVIPALGIDLMMRGRARFRRENAAENPAETLSVTSHHREWFLAAGLAAVWVGLFVPTQWFFSIFLLSDAADNWFFARDGHWPYFVQPTEWMNRFWLRDSAPFGVDDLFVVFGIALLASRLGLWCGSSLIKVRR